MKSVYRKLSYLLVFLLMFSSMMNVAAAANPSGANNEASSLKSELFARSLAKAEQYQQERLQASGGDALIPTAGNVEERSEQANEPSAPATDYKPNDKVQIIVELDGASVSEQLVERQLDFKDATSAQVNSYQSEIHRSQEQVLDTIDRMNIWLSRGYQFKNMLNAFSGEVFYKDINKIERIPGVKEVHIGHVYYAEDQVESEPEYMYSAPNIGTEESWDTGLQGEDVTIAIIDTGVNYFHPAFGGEGYETLALGGEQDLSPVTGNGQGYNERIIGGYNWADGNNDIVDRTNVQHGVHVAGIAAGYDSTGSISGTPFKGVAPKAKILAEKVFSNDRGRNYTNTGEWIAAIEHAVANGADVINMSLGSDAEAFLIDDPANQAIENAVNAGVVFAIAAGNASYSTSDYYPLASMRDYATIGSPSVTPSAISVAASANRLAYEEMTDFSSWGPEAHLDFKPNFTAPGEDVYSSVQNDDYRQMSGTSMAAPVVAGASALVIESFRNRSIAYTPQDVTTVLSNTAKVLFDPETDTPYSVRQQGAGRIQVDQAAKSSVWVTDLNGEAGVALKAFDQQTMTFSLQVKNVGDEERSFRIEGDAYKDVTFVDPDNDVEYNDLTLEKIEGADVSFDQAVLTVPAHSASIVEVTLELPNDLEANQFVDGWIYLTSIDELEETNLIVPYFGFYGDWNAPSMIDKHWFDYSYYGQTGLYVDDYPLGMGTNYGYMEEYAAFSPNDDDDMDVIVPKINLLRNAERLEEYVLDSQHNRIRTLMVKYNQRKGLNETPRRLNAWDGTVNYEAVEDGQYYIQVVAKAYGTLDSVTQAYTYPVKVDTAPPRISGQLIEDDGLTKLQIAGEDESGIYSYYVDIYDRNGVEVLEQYVGGEETVEGFAATLPLEELPEDPYVVITAYDYADNVAQVEAGTQLPFIYYGFSRVGQSAVVQFDWEATTLVADMTIQVDDQDEKSITGVDDWYDSYQLPLTYGDHTVTIRAFDADHQLVASIEESMDGMNGISLKGDDTVTTYIHETQPVEINYMVGDDRIHVVTMTSEDADQDQQQQINGLGSYTLYYAAPKGETVVTLQAWSAEDELLGRQTLTIRSVKQFDVQFDQEAYTVTDAVYQPVTMLFSEEVTSAEFQIHDSTGQSVADSVYISVTDSVYAYQIDTLLLGTGQFTLELDGYDANDQLLDSSNADLYSYPTGVLNYGDSQSMIRTNDDSLLLDWDYDAWVQSSVDVHAVAIKVDGEESPLSVNETSFTLDLTPYEDGDNVTVQIIAEDQEGQQGTLTYTIVRDLLAPGWIVYYPSPYPSDMINAQENKVGVSLQGITFDRDLDADSVILRVPGMEQWEAVQVDDEEYAYGINELVDFTKEGFQNIEFHYRDLLGNTGYTHRKVLVDLTSPTIEISNSSISLTESEDSEAGLRIFEDELTTTSSSFSLQGTVSDELTSFVFDINDSQIMGGVGYKIEEEEWDERSFQETVPLQDGENRIVLHAADIAGNQTFINLTVMKEDESAGGNNPDIPVIPVTNPADQQDEGAYATNVDKDEPGSVEIQISPAFVAQQLEEESESEAVTIPLTERNTETYHQFLFTMDNELTRLLVASGKAITFQNDQFEITIPNGAISDLTGQNGFQLKVKIKPLDANAGVTVLSDNRTVIVSPVLEIGEPDRILSQEIGIALTYNPKLAADVRKVGIYRQENEGWSYVGIPEEQDGNKLFMTTSRLGTFAAIAYDKTFADLQYHWAKEEIEALASQHVVNGLSDEVYSPDTAITRAEFAALLVRVLQLPVADVARSTYQDVPADAWYAGVVEAARQAGLIAGWGDGTFHPNDEITREGMVVMIVRALQPALQSEMNASRFEDWDQISNWAQASVDWASQEGLIQGMTATTFAPHHSTSRAQAAVMIYRLLQ